MKIETIRDPIAAYDKSVKERRQSRNSRLSQIVHRDKESHQQKREQRNFDEQHEEVSLPNVAGQSSNDVSSTQGLDVVV
ncbi:MAG: hypothetical protein KDD70_11835 [Bdellovibrionales bacterium]|nr:hypothetical protein [Bdellovibrionales bacterium]